MCDMFIKECDVCGTDMILQSYIDPDTSEKKNQFVCLHCGQTEDSKEE